MQWKEILLITAKKPLWYVAVNFEPLWICHIKVKNTRIVPTMKPITDCFSCSLLIVLRKTQHQNRPKIIDLISCLKHRQVCVAVKWWGDESFFKSILNVPVMWGWVKPSTEHVEVEERNQLSPFCVVQIWSGTVCCFHRQPKCLHHVNSGSWKPTFVYCNTSEI